MIILLIITSLTLFAKEYKLELEGNEYELVLENIVLKDLDFCEGKELIVSAKKNDPIQLELTEDKVYITSKEEVKIELEIPQGINYIYKDEDSISRFNEESLTIKSDDGEIIEFKDGSLVITEDSQNKVELGAEGINVIDDDEAVRISSRGIIIDSDDEYREITGFWGRLLGSFIHTITKGSMNIVSKKPAKIMKYVINDREEDSWEIISFNDDDEFEDITNNEFHGKVTPRKSDRFILENLNGNVDIVTWDEDYVNIDAEMKTRKGEKEFEKIEIKILQEEDIVVKTVHLKKNARVSVNYKIKIPKSLPIASISSSNGKVIISDCSGDIEISTSNGSIVLTDHKGNGDLQTSNGFIKASKLKGDYECISSNGKISLHSISGKVNARTSNGAIEIVDVEEIISAHTSNGKIVAELKQVNEDIDFVTSNSSIVLYLDRELDCELNASTSNSNIEIHDLNVNMNQLSKSSLTGRMGKGGPTIYASTSNGGIDIKNLK